jgi:D-xylose transport system substrate-binding protein
MGTPAIAGRDAGPRPRRCISRLVHVGLIGAVLAVAGLAGCVTDRLPGIGPGQESLAEGFKIGILLPESKTTRYETFDRPMLQSALHRLCRRCVVLYQNAGQDSAKQQAQAEAMLTQGVKVLILDAVDARAAAGIVSNAKGQGVAVVAYDRLATGPVDYYVSFDSRIVGEIQGQALLDAIKQDGDPRRGEIVMINGAQTDPNAADLKAGAHLVLDGQVIIGAEFDTPDWSNDKAQQEMEQAITQVGKDRIIGVYAANDLTAGGAVAAMKGAGFQHLPPIIGQDAELAAIQRVLAGQQYMTVYKAIRPEAEVAAEMAIAAATGSNFGRSTLPRYNGTRQVPAVLLTPVAVTRTTVAQTVIADGFYTVAQICTPAYASACAAAGLG